MCVCVCVVHWHCTAQLSMFNMEKRFRNKIIIIIIIIIIVSILSVFLQNSSGGAKSAEGFCPNDRSSDGQSHGTAC